MRWLRPAGQLVRRHRRWLYWLVVATLLAQMAFAMLTTAGQQTPTTDEPVYVATAVVYQQQHDLRYNAEHPPLGKLIVGSAVAVTDPALAPDAPDHWVLGRRLLYESGNDPWRLMLLARLPVIALTLLFGLVVFGFARDVAGPAGALVALALYAFSPDLIAHGSLATLDVPAAGFLLTAFWLAWRARDRPRLYLPLAGSALGAAVATKMSALPAVPVLAVLVFLSWWTAGRRRAAVLAAGGVVLLAVAVVWASYLAVDPRLRWSAPPGLADVGGLRGLAVDLMPLPAAFRDGMRIQFGFERETFQSFLYGRQYRGSRWYYLPAALLVKTPLGMLALWVAGAAAMLSVRRLRAAAGYVLLPAAVLLVVAMDGARNFGVRYVIFLPMFLSAIPASRCGWSIRAAGCRPGTASTRPIRVACRRSGCAGCWWCRTRGWPRRRDRCAP